jgi:GTP-sensing pleiotropic transcriptional regulator CodY
MGNLWHGEAPSTTKDDKRKNVTFIRTVSDDLPIGLTTSRLSEIEWESEIRSNSVVDMAISK